MPRAERKAQLIAVAEDIFARVGYAGTTMEAVSEAAGITKPVIYGLFGSKDGLLDAILVKAQTELTETLRQAWRAANPDSGGEGERRIAAQLIGAQLGRARHQPDDHQHPPDRRRYAAWWPYHQPPGTPWPDAMGNRPDSGANVRATGRGRRGRW